MGRQVSYTREDRSAICVNCGGTGVLPRKVLGSKQCPTCGGTGRQKPTQSGRGELSDSTPHGKETLEHMEKVRAEKKRIADKKRRKARRKWEREMKRQRNKKWTAEEVKQLQEDMEKKRQEKSKKERAAAKEQKQQWKRNIKKTRGPLG